MTGEGSEEKLMRIKSNYYEGAMPESFRPRSDERGLALVSVLLIMSLMLMLGLAVTFTAISDSAVTSNFKNTTSGFYAAEAGINNLHRLIRSKQLVLSSLPETPKVITGEPSLGEKDFIPTGEKLLSISEHLPNDSAYKTRVKLSDFHAPFSANDNDPNHSGQKVTYINPTRPTLGQLEPYSVNYRLESVGEGVAGLNGSVTLLEQGTINFTLLATANNGGVKFGSFSEFALYLDHFNPYRPAGGFIYQGLGPGDHFSGRVHTNERLGFWTTADGQDAPVFKGKVSQSYPTASYYRHMAGFPPAPVDADSEVVGGVLVAPKFLAGFDRGVEPIPPAGNTFNQARAVLDGGFLPTTTAPTNAELHANLRISDDLAKPLPESKAPTSTGPDLAPGVYIPTDGESFTGSGIYVMGDADDVQLTADKSGSRQIIKITRGDKTTTVTIDLDAGTTSIDSGHGVKTLRGIPIDRSLLSGGSRPAASLYVYGNVNSLHGPGRIADDQPLPGIDSDFAVTVTAGGYQTGDGQHPVAGGNIKITGDLVYETPVVDSAGNAINQNARNLLGIYASGGNIEIPIDGEAPTNLTVNASMAAFVLKDAQDNPVFGSNGRAYGGHVRSNLNNWESTPDMGRFTLVGGMQSSVYDNFSVYDGQSHGYTYQGVWDARYDQSKAPPFYPGYVVDTRDPNGIAEIKVAKNEPTVLSYKRVYYGQK